MKTLIYTQIDFTHMYTHASAACYSLSKMKLIDDDSLLIHMHEYVRSKYLSGALIELESIKKKAES